MTIAICNMQLKDIDVQGMLWKKFKKAMLKHGDIKPNFKGFMAKKCKSKLEWGENHKWY